MKNNGVGDEVFVFGTPRQDGQMPGIEKMVGERGSECTLYMSAQAAAKEMGTYSGFQFAVFRARIIIEEQLEMPDDISCESPQSDQSG